MLLIIYHICIYLSVAPSLNISMLCMMQFLTSQESHFLGSPNDAACKMLGIKQQQATIHCGQLEILLCRVAHGRSTAVTCSE